MKTFRLIGIAFFAVLVSVGFTACGSDDDDVSGGNGGNGGTVSDKRLVKMTEQSESKTYTYDYSYDSQGRVVRKEIKKNGTLNNYYVYTYIDNLIVQKYYYGNGASEETKYTLENGLIVSEKDRYETIQYTYENGYLATKTNENGVYKYKWNNGNLTSIELQSGGHLHKKNYEYTGYAAPQGFVTFGVEEDLGKFFGKSSKNLPSKFTEDDDEQITYDWTLKDGLPIKLIEMEKDGGGTYTTTTTFEWQ